MNATTTNGPRGWARREELFYIERIVHKVSLAIGTGTYCVPSMVMPLEWRGFRGPSNGPFRGWVFVNLLPALEPFGKVDPNLPPLRLEQHIGASLELIAGMCEAPMPLAFKHEGLLGVIDRAVNALKVYASVNTSGDSPKRAVEGKIHRLNRLLQTVYSVPMEDWRRYTTNLEEMWLWRPGE